MYYFKQCETQEELAESFRLRYQIFCLEKNWIDASFCPGQKEQDEYDNCSVHFIAFNSRKEPIGSTRLILNSEKGFPVSRHLDIDHYSHEKMVEVSRFAVIREERANHLAVFFGLTRLMWLYSNSFNMESWAAVVDKPLFKLFTRLHMPFLSVGKSVWYLGSESIPLVVDFKDTEKVLFNSRTERALQL